MNITFQVKFNIKTILCIRNAYCIYDIMFCSFNISTAMGWCGLAVNELFLCVSILFFFHSASFQHNILLCVSFFLYAIGLFVAESILKNTKKRKLRLEMVFRIGRQLWLESCFFSISPICVGQLHRYGKKTECQHLCNTYFNTINVEYASG